MQAQLKGVEEGEQQGAEQRLAGPPGRKDYQRDADPAAALHQRGEEAVEGGHGQEGPTQRHQPRARHHSADADGQGIQALRLDCMGVFARHPQGQTQRRAGQDPGHDCNRQKAPDRSAPFVKTAPRPRRAGLTEPEWSAVQRR